MTSRDGSLIPPLWLVIAALVCVAIGALAGCATRGPYWVHVRAPIPVRAVHYVAETRCGPRFGGCSLLDDGVIEILKSASPAYKRCALTHELRHFAGDDHPEFDTATGFDKFSTDCGDGTMLAAGA